MRALLIGVTLMLTVAIAAARPKAKKPKHVPSALVIVIDKSGSMQGARLDAAKAAILASATALDPEDRIAVIAFDSEATVVVQLTRAGSRKGVAVIAGELERMKAGGGTNIYPGLLEAFQVLGESPLERRHVLLLSDGEAPRDGILEKVKDMLDDKITISTIAVEGADEQMLRDISTQGGGRFYKVTDLKTLAPTFVKETRVALN